MKVHFMGNPSGNHEDYKRIIKFIESQGCRLVTEHILSRTQEQVDKELDHEAEAYVEKSKKWMRKADAIVFEVSESSISIGFEISMALYVYKKHVAVLYKKMSSPVLNSLKGVQSDKLHLIEYDDSSLDEKLSWVLAYAAEEAKENFTFPINSRIRRYFDWLMEVKNTTIADYLRDYIINDMRNNDEYNEYLE